MTDIDLNPIVKNIAVELTIITGELWTARADNSNYNQRPHADSPTATLYFSQDWRTKSRLTIRADAPAEIQEPRTGESITCDLTRTPQAIAQDINRRLLPHARTHLAESKTYDLSKRKAKACENCRDNLIKKYLPEEYNGNFFSKKKAGKNGYKSRVIASPTYDDMIEIELNLPLPEALKLLKQLTKEN